LVFISPDYFPKVRLVPLGYVTGMGYGLHQPYCAINAVRLAVFSLGLCFVCIHLCFLICLYVYSFMFP